MADPRQVFPPEVVALHDEHGVPWPTWFSGPLYDPSITFADAKREFEKWSRSQHP